jgi:isopenicillin-N epimerase
MTDGLRHHWTLDPEVAFINHGSFGACPGAVLDAQTRHRARLEREPVTFFNRDGAQLLAKARGALGTFVGANAADLAFVPNVTTGLNAVLQSIDLGEGDEVMLTDHEYNASRNIVEHVARRAGARVVTVAIPFPIDSPERILEILLDSVTPRTRLALVDHVTSSTGLVLPLKRIISELHGRGVEVVVDGAHAPGMVEVHLDELGADYYGANCHKWMCAPKGAGFIHVPRDRQSAVHPAVISHGANSGLEGPALFRAEFEWTGTRDITPWLAVEDAIEVMDSMLPGGWPEIRRRNHELALWARSHVAGRLSLPLPCPDEMVGSLATLILPESKVFPAIDHDDHFALHPLGEALFERYKVEIPIQCCPGTNQTMVRLSAALYNERSDYERLAEALIELL